MSYGGVLRVISTESDLLVDLNPQQKEAVLTVDGPLLVLAGAGTGKTRVLTSRIAHLISQKIASPEEILAVTFTNKAAFEMRQRVCDLISEIPGDMWIGTIHSMATKILRQHGDKVGIDTNFSILDDDDQLRFIKGLIAVLELDEKQYQPKVVMGHIRRWKDRGLFPWKLGLAMGPIETMSRRIYKEYQERLKTLRSLDFGDLILYCTKLFDEHPDILKTFHEKFKYILVDEYQDTNTAQYIWLKALASGHKNLCCVGDDDQAIYSWRGADVGNILRFENDFEGAKIIRLEQNYRSCGHILSAASGLIRNNTKRLGKDLWTTAGDGHQIRVKHAWNSEDEARFVCNEIEKLRLEDVPFGSMAVLVRASYQTREFEERFLRQSIPYQVIGGLRFYERQEIRDAIAYIRFLIDNNDSLAFERIINVPKRSIGDATLHKAHIIAQEEGVSVAVAAQLYASRVRGKASQAINTFFSVLNECRSLLENTPPAIVVKTLLEDSGYISMWKQEKTPEALARLDNLKELVNAIAEFDSLRDFVDHVALIADRVEPDNPDVVSMMTIHGAKGLEFGVVFLVGWEENLFPNQRTLVDNGMSGLEEERRLAYVAITRGKHLVIISYCSHRKTNNSGWQMATPSRFIRELPKDDVIFLDKKGVASAAEQVRDVSEDETPEAVRTRFKSM
ncbi:MAG: UvrD-helicase domain-containing protein [Holosporales bacterium]|nr:UvrD-helicase domain-containing protein [Holosporales bacterium]